MRMAVTVADVMHVSVIGSWECDTPLDGGEDAIES